MGQPNLDQWRDRPLRLTMASGGPKEEALESPPETGLGGRVGERWHTPVEALAMSIQAQSCI